MAPATVGIKQRLPVHSATGSSRDADRVSRAVHGTVVDHKAYHIGAGHIRGKGRIELVGIGKAGTAAAGSGNHRPGVGQPIAVRITAAAAVQVNR